MTQDAPKPRKPRAATPGQRLYRDAALKQGRGFTPDKQTDYLTHLSNGIPRGASAKLVGVTLKTIADYRVKDPAFGAAELEAEAVATEPAEVALRDLALSGHMTALMFYLQNRAPDRWKDMRQMSKTVKHEGTVTHALEAGASIQNIMELQSRLEERRALKAAPSDRIIDVEVLPPDDEE